MTDAIEDLLKKIARTDAATDRAGAAIGELAASIYALQLTARHALAELRLLATEEEIDAAARATCAYLVALAAFPERDRQLRRRHNTLYGVLRQRMARARSMSVFNVNALREQADALRTGRRHTRH